VTPLAEALRGAPGAREALVRHLMPVVRARVLRGLRRRAPNRLSEADDVVQTVWLLLWRDDARLLRAYDATRGASLEGYVGLVAEREVGNFLQRVTALRRGADRVESLDARDAPQTPSALASPSTTAEVREQLGALAAHLDAQLTPRARLVAALLYVDGHSVDDAARTLGVSAQSIYAAQHQIRAVARAFLRAQ